MIQPPPGRSRPSYLPLVCTLAVVLTLAVTARDRGAGHSPGPGAAREEQGLISRVKALEAAVERLVRTGPPVGSILPFVGDPVRISPHWQLCNGEPVKDPTSPLKTVLKDGRVPNLVGRFLRGTATAKELLSTG